LQHRLGNRAAQNFVAQSVQQPKMATPRAIERAAPLGGGCLTCHPQIQLDGSSDSAPAVKTAQPAGGAQPAGAVQPTATRDSTTCFGSLISETLQPTADRHPQFRSGLDAESFGNTGKSPAMPIPAARLVGDAWHFCVVRMKMTVIMEVQPVGFRREVGSADDPIVRQDTVQQIYDDMIPVRRKSVGHHCGKRVYPEQFANSSLRERYWQRALVVNHEQFHHDTWVKAYRPNLIEAEKKLRAYTLPASDAASADAAIAKARDDLYSYFIEAYEKTCAEYSPKQETNAYADGAPAYQKLTDEVKARAEKEKWPIRTRP
jgi:hypothetical protein